jgi:hypothetical protein
MFMMALMLFAIVVSYLLMFDLVKFAESVIDKALPSKLRDAIPSDTNANARSLSFSCRLSVYAVINPERF